MWVCTVQSYDRVFSCLGFGAGAMRHATREQNRNKRRRQRLQPGTAESYLYVCWLVVYAQKLMKHGDSFSYDRGPAYRKNVGED